MTTGYAVGGCIKVMSNRACERDWNMLTRDDIIARMRAATTHHNNDLLHHLTLNRHVVSGPKRPLDETTRPFGVMLLTEFDDDMIDAIIRGNGEFTGKIVPLAMGVTSDGDKERAEAIAHRYTSLDDIEAVEETIESTFIGVSHFIDYVYRETVASRLVSTDENAVFTRGQLWFHDAEGGVGDVYQDAVLDDPNDTTYLRTRSEHPDRGKGVTAIFSAKKLDELGVFKTEEDDFNVNDFLDTAEDYYWVLYAEYPTSEQREKAFFETPQLSFTESHQIRWEPHETTSVDDFMSALSDVDFTGGESVRIREDMSPDKKRRRIRRAMQRR